MPDSPSMQSLIFLYGPVLESSHGTISSISLITGLAQFGWVENITFLSILQLISAAQLHCPLPLFSIVLFFFFDRLIHHCAVVLQMQISADYPIEKMLDQIMFFSFHTSDFACISNSPSKTLQANSVHFIYNCTQFCFLNMCNLKQF